VRSGGRRGDGGGSTPHGARAHSSQGRGVQTVSLDAVYAGQVAPGAVPVTAMDGRPRPVPMPVPQLGNGMQAEYGSRHAPRSAGSARVTASE